MHLVNTSSFHRPLVRSLVRFAADSVGVDLDKIGVAVLPPVGTKRYQGFAWRAMPRRERDKYAFPRSCRYLVTVAISPKASRFPSDNLCYRSECLPRGTTRAEAERRAEKIDPRWMPEVREGVIQKSPYTDLRFYIDTTQPYGGRRSVVVRFESPEEALVGVLAHEFMHIDQFLRGRRASEDECERAAALCVREYRESLKRAAASSN